MVLQRLRACYKLGIKSCLTLLVSMHSMGSLPTRLAMLCRIEVMLLLIGGCWRMVVMPHRHVSMQQREHVSFCIM